MNQPASWSIRGLVGAEVGFNQEGQGGFEAQALGQERLNPGMVKIFVLDPGFGEKVVERL
ncbi:MAG: hypothetical protein WBG02_17180 [Candidatus Acidiferrum sp.]